MIEFESVTIQNFLSYHERQTIPLRDQGFVLIEGRNEDESGSDSNRAGKSALIDALVWCLFDRTLRGVRHNAVVYRFASKKDCMVCVRFRTREHSYSVIRYRKHTKHQHKLFLKCDGKPLQSRHKRPTQELVESILGMDFSSFVNSIVFGGDKAFALKADSEQKKVLEAFLRFGQFDLALKRTKQRISEVLEGQSVIALKTANLKTNIGVLREHLRSQKGFEKTIRKGQLQELKRLTIALKKLNSHEPEQFPKRNLDEAQEVLNEKQASLSSLEEQCEQREKTLAKISDKDVQRVTLVGKHCPTCGTLIEGKSLKYVHEHFLAERKKLRQSLHDLRQRLASTEREVNYARECLKRVSNLCDKQFQVQTIWRSQRKELVRQLKVLSCTVRTNSDFSKDFSSSALKMSKLTKRLIVLEEKLWSSRRLLKRLQFWEVGFGNRGIKSLAIQEILPALNEKLQEFTSRLFQNSVHVEFVPNKQTKKGIEIDLFHIEYKSKHGSNTYLGESSGGRRRADICILLTFSWLARSSNLLLVDELLDSLDEEGRDSVLDILRDFKGTTIVITHRRDVKIETGQIWVVVKRNRASFLEMPT